MGYGLGLVGQVEAARKGVLFLLFYPLFFPISYFKSIYYFHFFKFGLEIQMQQQRFPHDALCIYMYLFLLLFLKCFNI